MPIKKKTTTTTEKPAKQVVVSKFNSKPMFVYLTVRTGEDGLLSNYCKLKLHCNTEKNQCVAMLQSEAKVFDDKFAYFYDNINDPEPAEAVASTLLQRFSMTTFSTNPARRLPKNTTFGLYLRVAVARADQSIRVSLRKLVSGGKELTREDAAYRMFRKAIKLLPVAFARVVFERGEKVQTAASKNKPAVVYKKKHTEAEVEETPKVVKKAVKKPVSKPVEAAPAKKPAKKIAKPAAAKKVVKKKVAATSDDFEL